MPPTLGLDLGGPSPAPVDGRLVEVAVDAPAGPGPRTYTYLAPAGLGDLEPGEAVLVPFGRGGRQAIGIVVGEGTAPDGGGVRPIAARVRSDGPLLPPLSLAFAGGAVRAVPGPAGGRDPGDAAARDARAAGADGGGDAGRRGADGPRGPGLPPPELDLLDELAGRARAVRDLSSPEGRAALLRRLRALADEGLVELTWTLLGRGRRARATSGGCGSRPRAWSRPSALAAGERVPGRPLGPRQRAALAELAVGGAVPGRTARRRRRSPSGTARRPSPASFAAASCARRCASVRAGRSRAAPPRPAARARRARR